MNKKKQMVIGEKLELETFIDVTERGILEGNDGIM